MSRYETLRACHMHAGKKYIDKEAFSELSIIDRTEAILWLFWPQAVPAKLIRRLLGTTVTTGTHLSSLKKADRVVHIKRGNGNNTWGWWRFKPQRK